MVDLKPEVDFVLALRTIAMPCRIDYHAEFHSKPSTGCQRRDNYGDRCLNCRIIDNLIDFNFRWADEKKKNKFGEVDGHWRLK